MNKHIINLSIAIVVAVLASCQPGTKEGQNGSTAPKDTVVSQHLQPAESGYAAVKGLKMYMFEGTPIQKQYDSLGNDPAHFPEFVKKVISIDLEPYDWSEDVKNIQAPIFMERWSVGILECWKYSNRCQLLCWDEVIKKGF